MTSRHIITNVLGQPIGFPMPNWKNPSPPSKEKMEGRFCRVERLNPQIHAAHLFESNAIDQSGSLWTYLPYGPFPTSDSYRGWIETVCNGSDPLFFAIISVDKNQAPGVASYMRIDTGVGSVEVGHINYSPLLQRTPAATEAMYLMMKRAFESGYRRYEWKCDALNAKSRSAAIRLGFTFEGVFRQASIYKGRSRDTAWYSIIDSEWPALDKAFLQWLEPANFDEMGKQRVRLTELTFPVL